jgi:hypothetical protein
VVKGAVPTGNGVTDWTDDALQQRFAGADAGIIFTY